LGNIGRTLLQLILRKKRPFNKVRPQNLISKNAAGHADDKNRYDLEETFCGHSFLTIRS